MCFFFFALLLFFLLTPIRIVLRLNGTQAAAVFWLGGLVPLRMRTALRRNSSGDLHVFLRFLGREKILFRKRRSPQRKGLWKALASALKIRRISLRIRLGIAGDAALTALLCGLLQALLGAGLGSSGAQALQLSVEPDFTADLFFAEGKCMLRFFPGKAIGTGITALQDKAKEAWKQWRIRSKQSCAPQWKT